MKKTKFSSIIFLFTLSLIACEDKRSIFAEKIRSYVKGRTNPVKANELVYDIQNKLTILSYTLSLKELEETKIKYDLSDSLVMQIKAASFAREGGVKKIEEKLQSNFFTYEESLGVALKENDGKISFALIKTISFAKLKAQYEKYTTEECHRVWIFFKKCHDEERQRQRELTASEKIKVTEATKYSSINSLLGAVDVLKRGDYQLYMSDTGTIFSPDHKSVAHVTYFGNIAIGPTSELNSILPTGYEYQFQPNKFNGGRLVRSIKDDLFSQRNNNGSNMKNGKYFKFNYLRKDKKPSTFPKAFMDFIYTESLNGPYVLEVKKNGNVILYSKKDPNIILWTTNTANKGKGPYNFHLTNDKKLILQDSTGKILYESPVYKECPTIYYKSAEYRKYVSNGQEEYINIESPLKFNINTDSTKYKFEIESVEKPKKMTNGININFLPKIPEPSIIYKITKIDFLLVNKHIYDYNNDYYDICYTVYYTGIGWTRITCNGEVVGFNVGENAYIVNFIIYVKEKEEPVPNFGTDIPELPDFDPLTPPL